MGRAIALALARAGTRIVLAGRPLRTLGELKSELAAAGDVLNKMLDLSRSDRNAWAGHHPQDGKQGIPSGESAAAQRRSRHRHDLRQSATNGRSDGREDASAIQIAVNRHVTMQRMSN